MSSQTITHNPTNLVTEDYEFLFVFDNASNTFVDGESPDQRWAREESHRLTSWSDRSNFQCHHCGTIFRYGAILLHTPSGQHIAAGHTCLDNRFELRSRLQGALSSA